MAVGGGGGENCGREGGEREEGEREEGEREKGEREGGGGAGEGGGSGEDGGCRESGMDDAISMVNVVDGGQLSFTSVWGIEAEINPQRARLAEEAHRAQLTEEAHRAQLAMEAQRTQTQVAMEVQRTQTQMAVEAHVYDKHQIYVYLKDMGANPRLDISAVDQVLNYCNTLIKERQNAVKDAQHKSAKLSEARSEIQSLQESIKKVSTELRTAQSETDNVRRKYKENKEKLDKADRKREDAVASATRQLIEEKRELSNQLYLQKNKFDSEIMRINTDHDAQIKQLKAEHATALAEAKTEHEAKCNALVGAFNHEMDKLVDEHETETNILKEKMRELASDLISRTDDFRPATDQALRIKLLDLRNRIKNITVPNNLYMRTADMTGGSGSSGSGGASGEGATGTALHQLSPELDPTGFVARHGSRDLQYILRGLVWNVLIEAFFSAPFGFGFLGPDPKRNPGRQQLMDIHRTWSRLYEGQQQQQQQPFHSYGSDTDEFAMYTRDHNANKLRSAVFQSFLAVIFPEKAGGRRQSMSSTQADLQQQQQQLLLLHPLPPLPLLQQQALDPLWPGQFQAFQPGGGQGLPPSPNSAGTVPGVAFWYHQHCDHVVASIRQLLDRITGYATRPDALEAVPVIVNLAAELGIELGVQRAQVLLVMPRRNDVVQAGPEYQDCLGGAGGDGDRDQPGGGRDMKVDLLVSPGIMRIGDGRGDMAVRKALVPCEVIPFS